MRDRRQRRFEQKNRFDHVRENPPKKGDARTDLALEANTYYGKNGTFPGITIDKEEKNQIHISRMSIDTIAAAKRLGKAIGHYTTLEVPELRKRDPELQEQVAEEFANELKRFLKIGEKASVLVIGLGNWNVTPDSLGPLVVENLLVTRHLFSMMPEAVKDGFRSVCAFAPGVLGLTGIETSEIVSGIVERIKPELVIAIDALAARSLDRVNTTVQVADTGIQPGGGVGNHRKALNKDSLGVDVLAIGIPTVVDAATIASDAIDLMLQKLAQKMSGNEDETILERLKQDDKRDLIAEVLKPMGNNLMVTPKEVDEFVEDMAYVLALALNFALHPGITFDDAKDLTHG